MPAYFPIACAERGDKYLNAHLKTILDTMFETKLTNKERYEREFTVNLAAVDRWLAEDKDNFYEPHSG